MDSVVRIPTPLRGSATREQRLAAGATGATALAVVAATLGATGPSTQPGATALLRGTMVAAPLGVALVLARQRSCPRYVPILVAVGVTAFVSTLGESSDPTLYTVGRAGGWVLETLLVLAVLAFPTGRITDAGDRRVAVAAVVVLTTCFLPLLLLADSFKVPSPFTSCTHDCPPNAFFPFASQPPSASILWALAGIGTLVVMLATIVRLQARVAGAGPFNRQLLLPVLLAGMLQATLLGCAFVGRELAPDGPLVRSSALLLAWMTCLLPLAVLVGLVRSRLFTEHALRRLAGPLRSAADGRTLRRALAEAFEDETLEIAYPRASPPRWVDEHGDDLPAGSTVGGRCVHLVHNARGNTIAAILCHPDLRDRPELLEAAAALVGVVLDNHRLLDEVHRAADEVHRSRARLAATADRERRRIERDLHDGAQQRLVALRIELGLVEELARTDPGRCAARIRELEDAVDETLDDLRALAHGVCPPVLSGQGLQAALAAAAARSPVPVELELRDVGRYALDTETAVYFCVLEALQNVAKHARSARHVVVRVDGGATALTFSVRDDGPGGTLDPDAPEGDGVANMQDRMAAVGGELRVLMHPGTGTEVRGRVPIVRGARAAVHA